MRLLAGKPKLALIPLPLAVIVLTTPVWGQPRYSIKVPKSWERHTMQQDRDQVRLYVHPSHDFYVRVRVFPVRASANLTRARRIFEYRELKAKGINFRRIHKKQGQDSRQNSTLILAYKGKMEGIPIHMSATVIKKDKLAYSALLVIKERMLQRHKDTFVDILQSFAAP